MLNTLAFLPIPNLGWPEMLIIGVVMLLLFGRRLPEVGRSLGQGLVQFKKGLKDVGDEIEHQANQPDPPKHQPTPQEPAKFESAPAQAADTQRAPQGEPAKPETTA